jgi:stearoyl-CoA desaturase (delta-9 desaturase)
MSQSKPPINWLGASVLLSTPIAALILFLGTPCNTILVPLLGYLMVVFLYMNGLGITAGYHRLWAHKAYEAHWSVQIIFMLWGTAAIQNSILNWASGHRTHHRFVDDVDKDPYSAKRGFWFSHIGWMLRDYPSGTPDYSNCA